VGKGGSIGWGRKGLYGGGGSTVGGSAGWRREYRAGGSTGEGCKKIKKHVLQPNVLTATWF